jgi:hypothetical protein
MIRGCLVMALRGVDVRRAQSLCQLGVLDECLEFSDLSLVVGKCLTRPKCRGRVQSARRRQFEKTHVRHRRKHRAADMAGTELGNRPFLERAAEGASCRRLVGQLLEEKSSRVAVGIHGCMAVEERDAGGALLRIELHAEVCEPRRAIDGCRGILASGGSHAAPGDACSGQKTPENRPPRQRTNPGSVVPCSHLP